MFQCIGTNPAGSVQAAARLEIIEPGNLSFSRGNVWCSVSRFFFYVFVYLLRTISRRMFSFSLREFSLLFVSSDLLRLLFRLRFIDFGYHSFRCGSDFFDYDLLPLLPAFTADGLFAFACKLFCLFYLCNPYSCVCVCGGCC